MNYSIVLSKRAEKQLDKLSDKIVQPILEKITDLGKNPRPAGYKKLKGRHGYRVRVGDYRIIYDIYDHELVIDIIALGHRRDNYE